MREILKKLLRPVGPSGHEGPVAEAIRAEIEAYADEVRTDAMGSLIAVKRGSGAHPRRVMLSAHMDHIGFVVTAVEKEGFLRVTNVGGIHTDESLTRHVLFPNGTQGVIVSEPVEGERAMKHFFVDIGASSKEEAEKCVLPGDMCVYAPDWFELGEHRAASPAMDDRAACAMLVKLLQTMGTPEDDVYAVFSSQEEVGCRGAKTASFALEPDIGIALDVTAWGDTPGTKIPDIKLGSGIAVKFMDRASISHPGLRDELLDTAEREGIPAQREVLTFGGTDAGAMQLSRGGIPVCTLSIPCRYVHSACEVVDLRDMEAGVKLLRAWLKA